MLGRHAHILGNRNEPIGRLNSSGHCVVRGHGQRFPSKTIYSATVAGRLTVLWRFELLTEPIKFVTHGCGEGGAAT